MASCSSSCMQLCSQMPQAFLQLQSQYFPAPQYQFVFPLTAVITNSYKNRLDNIMFKFNQDASITSEYNQICSNTILMFTRSVAAATTSLALDQGPECFLPALFPDS